MTAEYIQDCSRGSDLLDFYAEREYDWKSAGVKICKAIAELRFEGWFPFDMKNLRNKKYFTVQRMQYKKDLYAVVTNSAINYIFKIYED